MQAVTPLIILMIILFLLFSVLGKAKHKNMMNPVTVFCGIWTCIIFGYSFRVDGLYQVSVSSLLLILTGVVMFTAGAFLANHILGSRKPAKSGSRLETISHPPHYMIILILNIISLVFLVGLAVNTVQLLVSGKSFAYIHKYYNQTSGTVGASRSYQNMITWFVWPLMDASLTTLAAVLHSDRSGSRTRRWCIVLIFTNLLMFTVITGKRAHLGYLVLYIVAAYFLKGKKLKLKRGTKILILLAGAGILWIMNYISVDRDGTSLLKTLYIYLVGCVPHLSQKLDMLSFKPRGIASVYGVYQPVMLMMNRLLHSSTIDALRSSMSSVIAFTQTRVEIAPGQTFNAFLSPFFYFYLDGGMIGNILFSALFGFVSAAFYQRWLQENSYRSMVRYLLVLFTLVMSMVRIQYFQMRFVLSFFYVFLFFLKAPRRRIQENVTDKRTADLKTMDKGQYE